MNRPTPPFDLAALRARIPILQSAIPMNGCSQAPQSLETRAAADRYLDSWATAGMDWDLWLMEVEAARSTFAHLINASPEDVAIFSSVSHATAAVASAMDLLAMRAGRKGITLTGAEFPTVAQVWLAQGERGFDLRWVPVEAGRVESTALAERIDERTLLVSAAHAYYQTGALLDLEAAVAAARACGCLLYVDAYQSLGPETPDVKALGIDMLASGNLKFLMGIPGIAFLYVKREVAERLEPAVTGWFGRRDPMAFDPTLLDWAPGARRFDTGTPPILPAYVARAGMETLLEVGLDAVRSWTRSLSAYMANGASARGLSIMHPSDPAMRTPTTAFEIPVETGLDSHAVEAIMRARGVLGSARGPAIRLAPNFFNSTEDIDRALDLIAAVMTEAGSSA